MRRLHSWSAISASIFAALAASSAPPLSGQDVSDEAFLEGLMREGDIPGLSIAVVSRGAIVWDTALGVADAETGRRTARETVFEAASLTKPVVAYAALKLVERGVLDLDTPLWESLSYPRLEHDPRSRRITARHVLSHTTGLPNWGGDPLQMNRAPGEQWGYSGEGFVYLQRVIETVTGEPLADFVQREVFEPLGMSSSSLVWRAEYEQTSATPHNVMAEPVPKGRPEEANAAASLHTTAVDYARFLAAVLQGNGLAGRTVVEMLSPVSQVEGWGPAENAVHLQWGLGWGIQNGDLRNSIWHWGDNGTFRCFVIAYPSEERGLVYFTNSENGLSIAEAVVSRFFTDTHHSIRWLDYMRWDDPARITRMALRRAFLEDRETGMERLRTLQAESPETVTGAEIGSLAGFLSGRGLHESAIAVAQFAVAESPGGDSRVTLAEVLTGAGRHEEALALYEEILELQPRRREQLEGALEWLRTGIEAARALVSLSDAELARYVGQYGPRRVRLADGTLVYSREGATSETELVPLTREIFRLRGNPTFRIRFVLDRSGRPVSLVGTYSDGREDVTPRTESGP